MTKAQGDGVGRAWPEFGRAVTRDAGVSRAVQRDGVPLELARAKWAPAV